VGYENLYFKNATAIFKNLEPSNRDAPIETKLGKLNRLEDDMMNEVDKFLSSIEKLGKKPNIDEDFVCFIERRTKIENQGVGKMKDYFQNLRTILRKNRND